MTSVLLGLALTSPQTAVAQPGWGSYPPPAVGPYHHNYSPGYPAARPVYAPPAPGYGYPTQGYGYPARPSYYPPVAPGEPVPGFPGHRPQTIEEFARCFQPTPGVHHVCLIHPCTGHPVKVCFTLRPGCVKVRASRREIEFDYRKGPSVEIDFFRDGRVEVDYD